MRIAPTARHADERLPRYTSYPTAPMFTDAITDRLYSDWLATLPRQVTASLYLHVPFCRSMCWYCGCNTTVARRDQPIEAYAATLRREIDLVVNRVGRRLPVRHVHFGGGTPTVMAPASFIDILALLRDRFAITADAEIAVEIDPRTLTGAMTAALGDAGTTRVSLGVQSFDPAVQHAINRVQGYAETAAATDGLRAAGVAGVNFDLIYGLPHQSVASCLDTVRQCLRLRPDRFSVFGYAHVPEFKRHQRRIDSSTLPDGAARLAQAEAIADALSAAGYQRIGLDHYALPDDPMAAAERIGRLHRNFQGYTTDPCDTLIGFGASAIGRLPQGFVQNAPVVGVYAARIARGDLATVRGYAMTADDRLRADIIERLMCDHRADVAAICRRHGGSPDTLLRDNARLQALAGDGLVRLEGPVVSVPPEARLLVRSVAAAFDAHLGTGGGVHSRAV
jgi:oxygen-independent coproporphyrinogen-3 oxidase